MVELHEGFYYVTDKGYVTKAMGVFVRSRDARACATVRWVTQKPNYTGAAVEAVRDPYSGFYLVGPVEIYALDGSHAGGGGCPLGNIVTEIEAHDNIGAIIGLQRTIPYARYELWY